MPTFSLKDQGQTLFFSWDSRFPLEYAPFWSLSDERKQKIKSVNRQSKIIFIRAYISLGYACFMKFLGNCGIAQTLCEAVEIMQKPFANTAV